MAFAVAMRAPAGGVEDGVEALGVEVDDLQRVALRGQRVLELGQDRADEARAGRMAEDDENLDGGAPRP